MAEVSLHEIAQRHGARLLLRFGSTLRGGTHQRSDVDVGVLFGDGVPDFERLAELEDELQAAFLEGPIDLAVLDRADPLFLAKVLERCELLAGEPRRLAELRGYAFRRYVDHKRFLAMEADYVAPARTSGLPMIDRELVTRKLLLVQQDLDALAPYARKPLGEYLVSPTDELVVERTAR